MSNVRIAQPERRKIVPAFIVQKLEGKVEHTVYGFDAKGKKKETTSEIDAGFMVSFPAKGHSIRIRTPADLKRLGFDQTIPLVDANSDNDDVEGEIPNLISIAS